MADGKTFAPGSVFVAGLRAVRPFESYIENGTGTRYMKVGGASGVDGLPMQDGFWVWTEAHEICISSSVNANVRIFDTVGRIIATAEVSAGKTVRIANLTPGIYIVGNKKINLH